MAADYYRKRVKPFLHALPILWAVISASLVVGTGHMNPAYPGFCAITAYPLECQRRPDVDCVRGEKCFFFV